MNNSGAVPIIGQSTPTEPAAETGPEELHVRTAFVTYITEAGETITTSDVRLLADHIFVEREAHPDEVYGAFKRGASRIEAQEIMQGTAFGVHQLGMAAAQQMREQAVNQQILANAGLR